VKLLSDLNVRGVSLGMLYILKEQITIKEKKRSCLEIGDETFRNAYGGLDGENGLLPW